MYNLWIYEEVANLNFSGVFGEKSVSQSLGLWSSPGTGLGSHNPINFVEGIWLVVEPTHLKNMRKSKWESSPNRGKNNKNMSRFSFAKNMVYLKPPPRYLRIALFFDYFENIFLNLSFIQLPIHGWHPVSSKREPTWARLIEALAIASNLMFHGSKPDAPKQSTST